MDLTVVVVSYNTRDCVAECLASVARTTRGLSYEVAVVDNASSDGSADMVARDFGWVTLIRNPENVGFARACNQAIRASSGRYILLLNSDAALLDGAAERMIELLDARPEAGAVGGMVLNPDGTFQSSYADFPGLWDEIRLLTGIQRLVGRSTYPSYPEADSRVLAEVDWIGGAFLMLSRRCIESVGLLDEDYFMYVEEMDWCYRAQRRGWSILYLPSAVALHRRGQSYQRAPEMRRAQMYRSKWLFMLKHRGRFEASAFRAVVYGVSVAKLAAWPLMSLFRGRAQRESLHSDLASYRQILANL